MKRRTSLSCCTGLAISATLAGLLALAPVHATPPSAAPEELAPPATSTGTITSSETTAPASFFSQLGHSQTLLGDMGGLRTFLAKYGMTLSILETSEVLGNVSGGTNQGFEYDGLTQMVLQLDTEKAFGLHGGTFNVSGLQIHGRNLSADNLATLQTASGIEADRSTRLWELWYDQKFLNEDRLDIKVGQQSLDQEFMVSDNALLFVNTMFGWPMLPSADLPGGGPAYPLSALGARFKYQATDSLAILAGVFNGTPVADLNDDPQQANATGTNFDLGQGALFIGELQYSVPGLGSMVYSDKPALSGKYKLGFWYDTLDFADQQYDTNGLSLANPASNGIPREHHGDYAFYGVVDQELWSDPSDEDADRTLNFFARAMGTPEEDRNLIDCSVNAGLTMHEPIPGRGDDTVGAGMGFTQVGDNTAHFDRDTGFFSGTYFPVQSHEEFVELTYQFEIAPWWQIQPDFQYVFNPGGGVLNSQTGRAVSNECVLGIRTNINF
jgi:porin